MSSVIIQPKSNQLPSGWTTLPGRGVQADELELGYISGIFGVRGEVRLHLHHRESKLLNQAKTLALISPEGKRFEIRIRTRSGAGGRVIGHIEGLADRDQARELKGWKFAIDRQKLPQLQQDEFLIEDVCGLAVFMADKLIGTVVTVHATDGGELFEIKTSAGEDLFVPSSKEMIASISFGEGGRVELMDVDLGMK